MTSRIPRVWLVLLLWLSAAIQGHAGVPGVTESEVVLGVTTPLSGPAAAWGTVGLGAEAWARHVNALGGVHGRKLRVVLRDDGYRPSRAAANVIEMKDDIFALVGLLGTATGKATRDVTADAGLPIVYPLGDPRVWAHQTGEKRRWVFCVYTDYADEGEFLVRQAVRLAGARRIALFYQDDDYGRGYQAGVRRGVSALEGRVTLVAEVSHAVGDQTLRAHALRLRDAGADVLIPVGTVTAGANVIKTMASLGYRPKIFAPFPFGDHQVMFRLLGELWEGAHFDGNIPSWQDPESRRIIEALVREDPRLQGREPFAMAGALAMMTTVEGLRRTGPHLTREAYVEAMEGIRNWVPEGLKWAPITFTAGRHHGLNTVRMYRALKATEQSYTPVSDWQSFPALF